MDGSTAVDFIRPSVEVDPEEPRSNKRTRRSRNNRKRASDSSSWASTGFPVASASQNIPRRASSHSLANSADAASNTGGISISSVLNFGQEGSNMAMYSDLQNTQVNGHMASTHCTVSPVWTAIHEDSMEAANAVGPTDLHNTQVPQFHKVHRRDHRHAHGSRSGHLAVGPGGCADNWTRTRLSLANRHPGGQQRFVAGSELFLGSSKGSNGALAHFPPGSSSPSPSPSTGSSSKQFDVCSSLFDVPDAGSSDADESEMTEDADTQPRKTQRLSRLNSSNSRSGNQRARNRVAATKFRAKCKAAMNKLEENERAVSARHDHLSAEKAALTDEVLGLRMELLRHSQCGQNSDIQNYLRNAARLIGQSGGTAAIWGPDGNGIRDGRGQPDGNGY